MENASKALLIAGAVLIAIILIGIAMMMLNGIDGITSQSGQQLDSMEIQMFNRSFTDYVGAHVSGSNVRALINNIIANNNNYSGDPSRQIKIYISNQEKTPTAALADIGANYRYRVDTDVGFGTAGMTNPKTVTASTDGYVHNVYIQKK